MNSYRDFLAEVIIEILLEPKAGSIRPAILGH